MGESSISSLNVKTRRRHSTSRLPLVSRLQSQFLLEIPLCLPDPHDHMSRFLSLSFSLFLPFSIFLSHPGPFFCAFPKFQSFITGWLVCLYLFSCPRMALKTMQCHIYLDWEFPILDSHVTWNTLWKCQILGGDGLVAQLSPTLAAPWTGVNQGSLSMGFSRQEYWSGLPFPSPRDLPDPGMEPGSPALLVASNP